MYDTLGEAKAVFLRPKGIPALASLDDLWLSNFVSTHSLSRAQALAGGGGGHACGNARVLHVRKLIVRQEVRLAAYEDTAVPRNSVRLGDDHVPSSAGQAGKAAPAVEVCI